MNVSHFRDTRRRFPIAGLRVGKRGIAGVAGGANQLLPRLSYARRNRLPVLYDTGGILCVDVTLNV